MFKTADLVGLDVLAHVAKNTYDLVENDEVRDSFVMPQFVNAMIEKKLLGKKSQSGFYKTDLTPGWQKIRKVIDPVTLEYGEYERASFPCLENAKKAAKDAGIEFHKADPSLIEAATEFAKADRATAAAISKERFEMDDADARVTEFIALVEKWEAISDEAGHDRDAMIQKVWDEVWSKVDLASYGM